MSNEEFELSLEGLSDEEKSQKRAEREKEETPEEKAKKLISKENRVPLLDENGNIIGGIDKEKFNKLNDKSKLYDLFSPVIDKYKDDPKKLEELLGKQKIDSSVDDRLAELERDKKEQKRVELERAVKEALSTYGKKFEDAYPLMKDQAKYLVEKNGLSHEEALRRSFFALHPEEGVAEADRISNSNNDGIFSSGGGRAPRITVKKESENVQLSAGELEVAKSLIGKDYGNGYVPIKSEADYARLLKKHESWIKEKGLHNIY